MPGITPVKLADILSEYSEQNIDSGTATSGSNTTLTDTSKNWPVNYFANSVCHVVISGIEYVRVISGNTADTLTIAALPAGVAVSDGNRYQITLSALASGGGGGISAPTAKAYTFNTALPTAEANWLAADLTPSNSPTYFRIYVCLDTAGILRVARTRAGTTVVENLNMSNNLVASSAYVFTISVRDGDSINFRYSVTGGNILSFIVDEIQIAA